MKLNCLLSDIKSQILSVSSSKELASEVNIEGLSLNSKMVKKGFLFFCVSGVHYKGIDFIKESYLNGARLVMADVKVNTALPKDLIIIRVKDILKCLGSIADKFYGHPLERLNLTAVTGTNGKTTVTFIMENILKAFKKNVGVIGTVNYRFAGNVLIARNTTPDILTTYSLMNEMLENKIKYLVMEASSHALAQRRIEGLKFDQAIFTNLSQDHFDYHKTKRNYFTAKSILFRRYLKERGVAIINIDDDYGSRLVYLLKKNKNKRVLTYGINKKADITADNIIFKPNGCCFRLKGLKCKFRLDTNLSGLFNIYNALAGITACLEINVPQKYIAEGMKEIYLPGRLEKVASDNNISIFVDYAHTEEALRNVLLSLKKLKGASRLIVVFGCGGDRDRDKRPKMGRVASELADLVIITSDNPRFEDPEKIISDIKKGIRKTNYITLTDREKAIKKALDMARSGDIIVVAGKGHEDYQIIKDKKLAFNDRLVIEEILSKKEFRGCLN